jgi:hypothetical protein
VLRLFFFGLYGTDQLNFLVQLEEAS